MFSVDQLRSLHCRPTASNDVCVPFMNYTYSCNFALLEIVNGKYIKYSLLSLGQTSAFQKMPT